VERRKENFLIITDTNLMTTSDVLTLIGGIGFFVLFIGIIVGFVVNLFYLNSVRKLLNKLKEKHPENWKALGEPTMFLNNSPKNSLRVWRYIRKEEYKTLNDTELNAIGSRARKLLRFGISYFIVLLALFIVVMVSLVNSH